MISYSASPRCASQPSTPLPVAAVDDRGSAARLLGPRRLSGVLRIMWSGQRMTIWLSRRRGYAATSPPLTPSTPIAYPQAAVRALASFASGSAVFPQVKEFPQSGSSPLGDRRCGHRIEDEPGDNGRRLVASEPVEKSGEEGQREADRRCCPHCESCGSPEWSDRMRPPGRRARPQVVPETPPGLTRRA